MAPARVCAYFLLLVIALIFARSAHAQAEFVVEEIEVLGTERIAVGTVLNYLPIRVGEVFRVRETGGAIRALYDTGLFHQVEVGRRGNVLVVTVRERPAIAEINVEGNSLIEEEQLDESLKDLGVERGRVFNRSVLDQVQQELRRLYFSQGYYAMSLTTSVQELERNRVAIDIEIFEGQNAEIRHINIIGNSEFSDQELLDLMESGIAGFWSVFQSAHEYSRSKLSGDLEILRSFYQDRGYIRFDILSTQVSISPDKRDIYITINIVEGEQYAIDKIKLKGRFPVLEEELVSRLLVRSGERFSRKSMSQSASSIASRIEEEGYAFANVNVAPEIDDERRTVDLNFVIDPGRRVYVRRIEFRGNPKTNDVVFRREMRQFEGGWYSPKLVSRSRVRLQRLPYVESVSVDTQRVPGANDQVDLIFEIKERPAGSFGVGLGFSSAQGIILNFSVTQENLFGTGNKVSAAFDTSNVNRQLSFSYTDPYFTDNGVSQSFRVYFRQTDTSALTSTSDYLTNTRGGSVRYGVPVSEFATTRLGAAYDRTDVFTTEGTPDEIVDFIETYGSEYDVLSGTSSWTHDTRNRTVYAETGTRHTVDAEVSMPFSDLEYYKLGYDFDFFRPVVGPVIFSFRTDLDAGSGYNDLDELPFFEKYYAGGIRSVRGYKSFSLGPRDSNGNAQGGDFRTIFTSELIFPPPWVEQAGSTRLSLFVDLGNVFEDIEDWEQSELRGSIGGSFNWLSPIGPLTFALSKPFNEQPQDELEQFQFAIGTLF